MSSCLPSYYVNIVSVYIATANTSRSASTFNFPSLQYRENSTFPFSTNTGRTVPSPSLQHRENSTFSFSSTQEFFLPRANREVHRSSQKFCGCPVLGIKTTLQCTSAYLSWKGGRWPGEVCHVCVCVCVCVATLPFTGLMAT